MKCYKKQHNEDGSIIIECFRTDDEANSGNLGPKHVSRDAIPIRAELKDGEVTHVCSEVPDTWYTTTTLFSSADCEDRDIKLSYIIFYICSNDMNIWFMNESI